MNSWIVLTLFLAAVNGVPLAGKFINNCRPFTPSHPDSRFTYTECDLACIPVKEYSVSCRFEIGEDNTPQPVNATKSKIEFEVSQASIKSSDVYLCVAAKTIDLADLPFSNRSECNKCYGGQSDSGTGAWKCDIEPNKAFTSDSMLAVEFLPKGKPDDKDSLITGAIWKVPLIQQLGKALEFVEVSVDVDSKQMVYEFFTTFN